MMTPRKTDINICVKVKQITSSGANCFNSQKAQLLCKLDPLSEKRMQSPGLGVQF